VQTRSDRLRLPLREFLRICERDRHTCHWCGRGYSATDPWEIDHITALANGGTNHLSNLALCHKSCNRDKGTLT